MFIKFKSTFIILTLLLVSFCGCCTPVSSEKVNAFSINLFKAIPVDSQNILISPYSAYSVLALLYPGAEGSTKTEIDAVFHYPQDLKQVADLNSQLQAYSNSTTTVGVANAIWLDKSVQYNSSYKKEVTAIFNPGLFNADFSNSEQSAAAINNWVTDNTRNIITNLISPKQVSSASKVILVNAIYFKGEWENVFRADETKKAIFTTGDHKNISVLMMHQSHFFDYFENAKIQALSLPYKNSSLSMLIVLPKEEISLKEMLSTLTLKEVSSWINRVSTHGAQIDVSLPKFNFSYKTLLNEPLQKLGLTQVFSDRANFSGILNSQSPLKIDAVIQAAHIVVDEKGTQAAAATQIGMVGSAEFPNVNFNVDHPFLFMIRDDKTKDILFMGWVNNPGQI